MEQGKGPGIGMIKKALQEAARSDADLLHKSGITCTTLPNAVLDNLGRSFKSRIGDELSTFPFIQLDEEEAGQLTSEYSSALRDFLASKEK